MPTFHGGFVPGSFHPEGFTGRSETFTGANHRETKYQGEKPLGTKLLAVEPPYLGVKPPSKKTPCIAQHLLCKKISCIFLFIQTQMV